MWIPIIYHLEYGIASQWLTLLLQSILSRAARVIAQKHRLLGDLIKKNVYEALNNTLSPQSTTIPHPTLLQAHWFPGCFWNTRYLSTLESSNELIPLPWISFPPRGSWLISSSPSSLCFLMLPKTGTFDYPQLIPLSFFSSSTILTTF